MPLNFDPNKLQDAMKTLFQGSGPNPLFDAPGAPQPAAPPPSAPLSPAAPAPSAPSSPPAPSAAPDGASLLYGTSAAKPPMSAQDFSASNPDATKAYIPARPRGPFDADTPHPMLRRTLASIFAGMAEYGRPGAGQSLINRWGDQDLAERQYDANLPRMQAGALQQAYQAYLQQQGEGANIQHTQAETKNLQANVPLLQHQQQFLDKVRGLKESGKYASDGELFNAVLPEAGTIPGLTRQMIVDQINNAKSLGPQFSVQADKGGRPEFVQTRSGQKVYPDAQGKFADPEMQKQWDSEMTAHGQSLGEEENKEKRVAGFAASRQAQAFSNQQEMENTKKMQPAVDTALTADQRLARMEKSYEKAKGGDQQAMLALLADHLGMTFGMQKGAKLNRGLIEEAQQSQPWLAKIGAKFDDKGYLSGVALGPEQMKQMLDLGYDARDQAWKGAHDAATTYGVPLPPGATKVEQQRTPGDKRLLQQGGQGGDVIYARDPQGQLHKAAKGTALPQGWKAENAPATK